MYRPARCGGLLHCSGLMDKTGREGGNAMEHAHTHDERQASFTLEDIHCPGCADAVERALRASPHIAQVHLDWAHNTVHVGYRAGLIDEAAIRTLIAHTGCECTP